MDMILFEKQSKIPLQKYKPSLIYISWYLSKCLNVKYSLILLLKMFVVSILIIFWMDRLCLYLSYKVVAGMLSYKKLCWKIKTQDHDWCTSLFSPMSFQILYDIIMAHILKIFCYSNKIQIAYLDLDMQFVMSFKCNVGVYFFKNVCHFQIEKLARYICLYRVTYLLQVCKWVVRVYIAPGNVCFCVYW